MSQDRCNHGTLWVFDCLDCAKENAQAVMVEKRRKANLNIPHHTSSSEYRHLYQLWSDLQSECERKDKLIAELENDLEYARASTQKANRHIDVQSNELTAKDAQLAKYKAALDEIAKDFGTDYCDGNTMIARAALAEGEPTPDKKDE